MEQVGEFNKKRQKSSVELKKCNFLYCHSGKKSENRRLFEQNYWVGDSSILETMVAENIETGEIRCVERNI